MNDAHLLAQIEQFEMVLDRLECDVDNMRIEIGRLKMGICQHNYEQTTSAGAIIHRCIKCGHTVGDHSGESWQIAPDKPETDIDTETKDMRWKRKPHNHPGESWQTDDLQPYHWHGKERCNCAISFVAPDDDRPGESRQTEDRGGAT